MPKSESYLSPKMQKGAADSECHIKAIRRAYQTVAHDAAQCFQGKQEVVGGRQLLSCSTLLQPGRRHHLAAAAVLRHVAADLAELFCCGR